MVIYTFSYDQTCTYLIDALLMIVKAFPGILKRFQTSLLMIMARGAFPKYPEDKKKSNRVRKPVIIDNK